MQPMTQGITRNRATQDNPRHRPPPSFAMLHSRNRCADALSPPQDSPLLCHATLPQIVNPTPIIPSPPSIRPLPPSFPITLIIPVPLSPSSQSPLSFCPVPPSFPPPSFIRPMPRHSHHPSGPCPVIPTALIHPAPATVIPVAPVTSFPRKRKSSSTRQTRTHRNSHTTQQRPLRPAYTNSKTGYEADRASFSLKIFIGSHHS